MKILRGLLIILLFQVVQRVSADFWTGKFSLSKIFNSEPNKNDEERTVLGKVWSIFVHRASWLATEVKDVAKVSANKAKRILKWKDTTEGIRNNNEFAAGSFKDNWSYFNDKVKGFYSAIFMYKLSNVVALTTDDSQSQDISFTGSLKSLWSYTDWLNPWAGEQCTAEWISGNTEDLEIQLTEFLYGQHLVVYHVPRILKFHINQRIKYDKPLVLSLHGSTGVGKNYVSELIVRNLFKLGEKSKFVTTYSGRLDFSEERQLGRYKERLINELVNKVSVCERHVFIFDEVDKIPPGLLDVLKPFVDYNMKVRGVDFRKTIFIFISNLGQNEINNKYMDLWKNGRKRADMQYLDFEKVLRDGVFNHEGGLRYSDNIKSHLIDLYMPFLPLEEEHVKSCIKYAFKEHFDREASKADIEAVHKFVDYGPEHNPIFAKTGCKSLTSKVAMRAHNRRREL